MSVNKSHQSAEVARNHLLTSLNGLASDDCAKTSRHLWFAAREAVIVAGLRRNWPVSTDEEIKDATRRLDAEYGHEQKIVLEFHTAEMFRDNADYCFLDKDEVVWFQPIVHEFVDRLLNLHPAGKTE